MCPLCGDEHSPATACAGEPVGSRVGQVIADKYRLVRRLGEGGMGAVYEGWHLRIQRPFALKFIHAWLATDSEWSGRFRREASAAGKLVNDHIGAVLDFGTTPDSSPFIVMELLRGETLAERQARTPLLSVAESVDILVQACHGLHAAHAENIVHRDIKPENLFLCQRDAGGVTVKILDFGIAKLLDSRTGQATKTGRVMGTPGYMSPEQARGEAEIDQRTDIYSLGVIAYELFRGQHLFTGNSYNAILYQVLNAHVPRIERYAAVTEQVGDVVHKALARRVSDRYERVDDFAQELLAAFRPQAVEPPKVVETDRIKPIGEAPPSRVDSVVGQPQRPDELPPVGQIPMSGPSPSVLATVGVLLMAGAIIFFVGRTPLSIASDSGTIQVPTGPIESVMYSGSPIPDQLSQAARDVQLTPVPHLLASHDAGSRQPAPTTSRLENPASLHHVEEVTIISPSKTQPPPSSAPKSVPSGMLTVMSDSTAALLIGGHPRGQIPTEKMVLPVGLHRLLFVHPEHGRHHSYADIRAGELTVVVSPWSAAKRAPTPLVDRKVNCTPPWELTADSVRRVKQECLHFGNPYR